MSQMGPTEEAEFSEENKILFPFSRNEVSKYWETKPLSIK